MAKECYINSKKVDSIRLGSQNTNCLTQVPNDISLDLDALNATIVGSLTANNGVFSGFSASNYLNVSPPKSAPSNCEIVICFTTPSSFRTNIQSETIGFTNQDYKGQIFYIVGPTGTSGKAQYLCFNSGGNGSSWGGAIYSLAKLNTSTKYWAKATWNGTTWSLYLSTDGTSYTFQSSINYGFGSIPTAYTFGDCTGPWDGKNYFTGSIDLTQCYIKFNGELWWQGGTGALIVLKDSKIYIPNGFEDDGTTLKFDEVIIENDTKSSVAFTDNDKMWAVYYGSRLITAVDTHSGSTTPTDLTDYHYDLFYNTSENKCYYCIQVDGVWKWEQISLPLGLVTRTKASGYNSIIQTFDSFGYMGSVLFALPNVKGLCADGFNEDGTYKSIEIELDKVLIDSGSGSLHTFFLQSKDKLESTADSIITSSTLPTAGSKYERCYVSSENQWYYHTAGSSNWVKTNLIVCGSMSQSNSKITSLTPRLVESPKTTIEVRRVYKGSQLIWGYDSSEVIFQSSTAGTYTVDIATSGYYNVTVVGAGSGGAYVYSSKFSDGRASGGSGAGFKGVVYLTAGSHTIKVGAGGAGKAYEGNGQSSATSTAGGQSSIGSIVVAGGGGAAYAGIHGATQTAGSGGTLSYETSKVQSYSLATNGKAGTTVYNSNITGGASVCEGYGKGGNAGNSYTTAGGSGYVLITAV